MGGGGKNKTVMEMRLRLIMIFTFLTLNKENLSFFILSSNFFKYIGAHLS